MPVTAEKNLGGWGGGEESYFIEKNNHYFLPNVQHTHLNIYSCCNTPQNSYVLEKSKVQIQ